MTDRYASFANSGLGRTVVTRLGLPQPPRLRRYRPGVPPLPGPALLGGSGRLTGPVRHELELAGIPTAGDPQQGLGALVYDASGIADVAGLRALYDFFHPTARLLTRNGRVVVLGTPPEAADGAAAAAAQRGLEGFVRSVGKEFGRGSTAQTVYVAPGAEDAVGSTLRFLLSPRSAYVSGQVVTVSPAPVPTGGAERPLAGATALVTGAARGIGAAIARVLARDGAHVVALDVAAAGDGLAAVANEVAGTALQLDLTAADAPARLVEHVRARHGRLDILVHNAGVTRDKTIARMSAEAWDAVLAVNLAAPLRVTEAVREADLLPAGGRVIGVSSIGGIAGNRGQTNYATSKAGVIGMVRALAPELAPAQVTVNAVAPGFIETDMTARMPTVMREAGRRMNSLAQGGLPVDVAETVAWLAAPGSAGVTGNVVRVCGQSLLGA
ncbi:MAG TPA: 3-oxoacyl-ACP reductase [Pilimelia sp.]|nr:3-oxoacyl-ACP reductase [Pilimelia sp.]